MPVKRTPPPPPRPRRKNDLYASVKVKSADETYVLPVRNISLGGVTLDARTIQIKRFNVGSEQDLLVFDAGNEDTAPLRVQAEVARSADGGVSLRFKGGSPDVDKKVHRLLAQLLSARIK